MTEPPPTNTLKSATVVGFMTLLSRISGVATRRMMAHILGGDAIADAFTVAYRLPNLLRRFTAEGTMTSALLPTLGEIETKEGDAGVRQVAGHFIGTLATTLCLFCGLAMLAMGVIMGLQMIGRVAPGLPLMEQLSRLGQILAGSRRAPEDVVMAIDLGRLMFPYLVMVSVTAGISAVLNLRGKFALPASVSTFFNLAFIGSAWTFTSLDPSGNTTRNAFWLALSTLLAGFVQVGVLLPSWRRLGFRIHWGLAFKEPGVGKVFRRMVPGLLGTGIHPINVYISMLLVSQLRPGAQTVLMNANILSELVLGLFSASIATASLPAMSRLAEATDSEGLRLHLVGALRGTAMLAIPASMGLAVLSEPICALLFRTGRYDAALTTWTAQTMAWQTLGILFVATSRITTQCFYALKDYRTPAMAALLGVVANIGFSILLLKPMGTQGISLANGLAALVNLSMLAWVLKYRLPSPPVGRILKGWGTFSLAALPMGLVAWTCGNALEPQACKGFWPQAARLFPVITLSGLCYFALLWTLRIQEARDLGQLLARKLRLPVGQ